MIQATVPTYRRGEGLYGVHGGWIICNVHVKRSTHGPWASNRGWKYCKVQYTVGLSVCKSYIFIEGKYIVVAIKKFIQIVKFKLNRMQPMKNAKQEFWLYQFALNLCSIWTKSFGCFTLHLRFKFLAKNLLKIKYDWNFFSFKIQKYCKDKFSRFASKKVKI